jgi:tetratricopeptide (TPR) repeat protein
VSKPTFFVSYTGADRAWAEWIAWQLEAAGYTVTVQVWDSRPGNDFVAWMDRSIRAAERILVVLTPAYDQATSFTVPELTAAIGRDPTGELGVLLPVRVVDFTPDGLLRTRGWVDLVGKDRQAAREALLAGVSQERPKPDKEPPFPGEQSPEPAFPGQAPSTPTGQQVAAALDLWNVSVDRNPAFTGRVRLLDRLRRALTDPRQQPARVAVSGLGGVGKTQLVVEYANRYRQEYRLVWWVRADRPATIRGDLAGLAAAIGLDEAADPDQSVILAAVDRWLAEHDGWLLIFDNADQADTVAAYLPTEGAGQVVISSRDPVWRRNTTATVPVDVLERAEAVRFVLQRTGQRDRVAAGALAEALGDLPLALEQACAYVEVEQLPLAAYLELLREDAGELFAEGRPPDYQHTVVTTWARSFTALAERSPAAHELLRLLAFLGPDSISRDLLAEGTEVLPMPLAGLGGTQVDRAIGALGRYSLAKRSDDLVSVHRLVQAVVREELDADGKRAWAGAAVRLVAAAFPTESWDVRNWPACEQLLAHALAAAEHAERQQVEADLTSGLLIDIAGYFRDRVQFTATRTALERALAVSEAAHGVDVPETTTIINNLGYLLQNLGDPDGARAHYERALRIDEAALGPDHPDVAIDLSNLGGVLRDLGDLEGARAYIERALRILEAVYGADHPIVAVSVNNLGIVLRALGDLEGARAHYERALRITEAALGPDHPTVAIRVNNLGGVLQNLGDLAGARAYHERALRIDEAAYGLDHPTVAIDVNNLGIVLQDLGDLEGARAHYERALRITEAALGPDHPTVAIRVNNLGSVLQNLGDLAGARAYHERALRILEAVYGADHPRTRTVARSLVLLQDRQ